MSFLLKETGSLELLRPVAIEGESVLACIAFVPLSLATIVAAAFLRSLLDGAACAYVETACRSANGVPVTPISFAAGASLVKLMDVTGTPRTAPWAAATGYSTSTGWDSPRHYEILASGGLPYVLDLCALSRSALGRRPRAARGIALTATRHHRLAGSSARSTRSLPCPRRYSNVFGVRRSCLRQPQCER